MFWVFSVLVVLKNRKYTISSVILKNIFVMICNIKKQYVKDKKKEKNVVKKEKRISDHTFLYRIIGRDKVHLGRSPVCHSDTVTYNHA